MKTKLIKLNNISLFFFIYFTLITIDTHAQYDVDTLQLFSDTTTFLNAPITVTDWVSNLAVKFSVDSTWNDYTVEKILTLFFKPDSIIGDIPIVKFDLSIGLLPQDSVLITQETRVDTTYPNWKTIKLLQPVVINTHCSFYIAGELLFCIAQSYWNEDSLYKNHYYYFWESELWNEGNPFYYPIKVVVKKVITENDDKKYKNYNYKLYQNYPNPFNSSTSIKYDIKERMFAKLEVFDILGRKIKTLLNEEENEGSYEKIFDATGLPSGVYYYFLSAGDFKIVKKMIYLK